MTTEALNDAEFALRMRQMRGEAGPRPKPVAGVAGIACRAAEAMCRDETVAVLVRELAHVAEYQSVIAKVLNAHSRGESWHATADGESIGWTDDDLRGYILFWADAEDAGNYQLADLALFDPRSQRKRP